ncbi:MAG: DNA-3-methyladenine glycosylase [Planctomycetaceae bacterium]|nr:DNA-3-methyladenine glycosylase [Planctomycetaceae bacterium]
MLPLGFDFFDRPTLTVAREILGCTLHWNDVSGIVVETEAYGAVGDEACHTSFRPSARRFFDSHSPGTAYVYMNYGIHWMLNVLARDGIVLIRALEPRTGVDLMIKRRGVQCLTSLCSGPGKLGQALGLSAEDHGTSLLNKGRCLTARSSGFDATRITTDTRIGITRAAELPWRFLLDGHPHVSVPVKTGSGSG